MVRPRLVAHIAFLRADLAAVDRELAQQIEQRPIWRARDAPLRIVPGVGPVLATTLLTELPELGQGAGRSRRWSGWRYSITTAVDGGGGG